MEIGCDGAVGNQGITAMTTVTVSAILRQHEAELRSRLASAVGADEAIERAVTPGC
jgi:hypothetical protein